MSNPATWIFLFLLTAGVPCQDAPVLTVVQTLRPSMEIGSHALVDVDGNGTRELVTFGLDGAVRTYAKGTGNPGTVLDERPAGSLTLTHPESTLYEFADVLGTGGQPQLVVLSPAGFFAYPPSGNTWSENGIQVQRRARLRMRLNRPMRSEMLQDANGDGRPDLVVPTYHNCELWLNEGVGANPHFRKAATISVDTMSLQNSRASHLSDVIFHSFTVPHLDIRDINADGRRDLIVENDRVRSFHLQKEDGVIPEDPTTRVDLRIFRDTTPSSGVRLGRTFAGMDRASFRDRDLDGDGIEDYVVGHRRKVWVFHGTSDGPQFKKPSTILKTADDVTMLLLLRVDEDSKPDLVIVRVQIPSMGALVGAFFGSWEVEISIAGYRNADGRRFELKPAWRRTLKVQLPSISGILKNPAAILQRFEDAGRQFHRELTGDFDGDGHDDVVLLDRSSGRIDLWRGAPSKGEESWESIAREILFGEEADVWDIDRALEWMGRLAKRRVARVTGGRKPDATYQIPRNQAIETLDVGDLDGDGRAEIIAPRSESGRTVFDILCFRGS